MSEFVFYSFVQKTLPPFFWGRRYMHFCLKRQQERKKNVLHTWKTHPKSAQGAEFSKLQKLLMEGWICYISVVVILISHCLSQAQVQYTQSCVRGKWENNALSSLMCDKNYTYYLLSCLNLPNCNLSSILLVPSPTTGTNISLSFLWKS